MDNRRVRSANEIHEVVENRPSKILFSNFFLVEKNLLNEIVKLYGMRSTVIRATTIVTMAPGTCESLNLMVGKPTGAAIR